MSLNSRKWNKKKSTTSRLTNEMNVNFYKSTLKKKKRKDIHLDYLNISTIPL